MVWRVADEAFGGQVDESEGQPVGLERNLDTVCRGRLSLSGQSWQLLLFCPSGQHCMSSDIAAILLISPTGIRFATTGDTSGATTSPTITKTASKRPMSRRRFMTYHHTG
jgi:hypothetical protein